MSKIKTIRKELLLAMTMLNAARNQKSNLTDRLMRMDGSIALAEMHLEKAKELLQLQMNEHEEAQKQ